MGEPTELPPHQVADADEFIAAMRHLKSRSGLTYRQLEERAAEHGDVLPRSTLAGVLRGRSKPRPELLVAFVRACGSGGQEAAWLEAWDRVAGQPAPPGSDATGTPSRARRLVLASAAVIAIALGVTAVMSWGADGKDDATEPGSAPARASAPGSGTSCRLGGCRDKDPEKYACLDDGKHVSGLKTQGGLIELFHSPVCQALWAEVSDEPSMVSVYLKSDDGVALTAPRDRLRTNAASEGSMVRTPMLPSKDAPRHAQVCVTYREFEACAGSDNVTRVKPFPSRSAGRQ